MGSKFFRFQKVQSKLYFISIQSFCCVFPHIYHLRSGTERSEITLTLSKPIFPFFTHFIAKSNHSESFIISMLTDLGVQGTKLYRMNIMTNDPAMFVAIGLMDKVGCLMHDHATATSKNEYDTVVRPQVESLYELKITTIRMKRWLRHSELAYNDVVVKRNRIREISKHWPAKFRRTSSKRSKWRMECTNTIVSKMP